MKQAKSISLMTSVMLFAAIIFSCAEVPDDDEGGYDASKSIKITGLYNYNSSYSHYDISVYLHRSFYDYDSDGSSTITGNSQQVFLYNAYSSDEWIGNGEYFIMLEITNYSYTDDIFVYTNGRTLSQLGIDICSEDFDYEFSKLPKYNISSSVSTIDLDKFQKINYSECNN